MLQEATCLKLKILLITFLSKTWSKGQGKFVWCSLLLIYHPWKQAVELVFAKIRNFSNIFLCRIHRQSPQENMPHYWESLTINMTFPSILCLVLFMRKWNKNIIIVSKLFLLSKNKTFVENGSPLQFVPRACWRCWDVEDAHEEGARGGLVQDRVSLPISSIS